MNFENLEDGTARQIQRSWEIEDHVLTGHASFRPWCAARVQGRGRAERHQGEGRKELNMVRRSQSSLGIVVALEPESNQ